MSRRRPGSQALVQGAYLVNTSWLDALRTCLNESWKSKGAVFNSPLESEFPIPPPPALQDSPIDWQPNPARISLFEHHRFISLVEPKIKNLGQVIECAGGRWSTEEPNSAMKVISECLSSTMIPVFLIPPGADGPEQFPNVENVLKRMNYRWVQEDEIGKAVLSVATDMYCNPKYMDELPSYETMSLMLGSMNQSQSLYMGSLAVPSTVAGSSTLEELHTTHGAKESPHVIEDDEDAMSLSQFMPRTKKYTKTRSSTFAAETAPSSPKVEIVSRPAKKKDVKQEVDIKKDKTAPIDKAPTTSTEDILDHEDDIVMSEKPEEIKKESSVPSEMLSSASQLLKESTVATKKKKPTAYDAVREDMIALNLDRKVGRQKENLDEAERGKRLEAQRDEAKNKSLTTGLMQSERCGALLAKHKRRKLIEPASQAESSLALSEHIKPENLTSLQILDDIKREDWPERWKALPNFKTRPVINPELQARWKDVPNYKTFRKSVLPGIQKAPGQPKPLALDGEIVTKQEEVMKKIETYIKREERPSSTSKALPKLSEKQMVKNDVKALLYDD
ncbi:hypothetical protein BGZ52_008801 [Haplosporangium bisporale]|nr:hypothetical protein BGZ52_008801 [Haplosporangium bisporale]